MEAGVKIILERMKTNPEEFTGLNTNNKWGRIIADYQDILNPQEIEAIKEGLRRINLNRFNEQVLKTLMNEQQEEEEWDPFGSAPMKMAGSAVRYDGKMAKIEAMIAKQTLQKEKEKAKQAKLDSLVDATGGTITYKTKGRYKPL